MNDYFEKIESRLERIEEKINYMLSLMEELFADDEDNEDETVGDGGNEGWISELDIWKDNYDEEDE
jgi:hypothetical protein